MAHDASSARSPGHIVLITLSASSVSSDSAESPPVPAAQTFLRKSPPPSDSMPFGHFTLEPINTVMLSAAKPLDVRPVMEFGQ